MLEQSGHLELEEMMVLMDQKEKLVASARSELLVCQDFPDHQVNVDPKVAKESLVVLVPREQKETVAAMAKMVTPVYLA